MRQILKKGRKIWYDMNGAIDMLFILRKKNNENKNQMQTRTGVCGNKDIERKKNVCTAHAYWIV